MGSAYPLSVSPGPNTEAADQRMADLAAFADGLVHDVRNPLNVIRSNLYLLRQRLPEDPRTERALSRMDDQVTVALRLLEGVQAFYRCDRPAMQRVQLNDVVRGVVATIPAPEECELRTELDESLPLITADPQLIDAGLRAMLRNALDAVPGGGVVTVRTAGTEGRATLSVEDTGPGIDGDALPRVFDPFYTTRKGRSGLGLPLLAKIGRAHGGEARLDTGPEGSRTVLELPIGEPSAF